MVISVARVILYHLAYCSIFMAYAFTAFCIRLEPSVSFHVSLMKSGVFSSDTSVE